MNTIIAIYKVISCPEFGKFKMYIINYVPINNINSNKNNTINYNYEYN